MNLVNRRLALFVIFLLCALPLFAANDIAAVRYAPFFVSAGAPDRPKPLIAASGNHFLTLWGADNFWNYSSRIYGTRSDASGGSNSPAFAAVPYYYHPGYLDAVLGTGSGYVAIWRDWVSGPMFGRFTSEGVLERSVTLDRSFSSLYSFVLARNGSRIAIVHTDNSWIAVSILDLDGNLLRTSRILELADTTYAVAALGDGFAVLTAGNTGIIQWRIANDGIVHEAVRRVLPPAAPYATYAIATAGKNGRIVAAWRDSFKGTVVSATIQPDGTITQNSLATSGAPPSSAPVVLPLDRGYAIAWNATVSSSKNAAVVAVRLDENGTPLDDRPLFIADGQFTSAASSGSTIKFAFMTSSPGSFGVATVTATVDAFGIFAQPAAAVLAPVPHFGPKVTGNGAGFTAAWLEEDVEGNRVVAARMNPAGEPLDGTGILLDLHATGTGPAIAHGPSEDLIVWAGAGRLNAARLSASGQVLDATPIVIGYAYEGPFDVVWNGSRFFVVWVDQSVFYYAFVGPDGVATRATKFSATESYHYAGTINVAWDGRQYIVVYKNFAYVSVGETPLDADIRVMRLSANGDVLDRVPALIPFRKPDLEDSAGGFVHVASSGSESLIVFDRDSGPVGVVVSDQGATLHLGPEVTLFHWEGGMSGVAWNGSAYVVAAHYALIPTDLHETGWLSAIEVSQSGRPLRAVTTAVSGPFTWWDESPPSVTTDPAAGMACVTTEITGQSAVPRGRIHVASEFAPGTMPPPPPAPRNIVSSLSGTTARIDWQSDGGADGFVIDVAYDFGKTWWRWIALPADTRTVTLQARAGNFVRIRAYGPGGFSEGSITSISGISGRRAGLR